MGTANLNETAAKLARELYAQTQRVPDEIPEEFKNRQQWEKWFDKGATSTKVALNKLVAMGKVERKKFRVVRDKCGRVALVDHWRMK